jgi:hypothetical protein
MWKIAILLLLMAALKNGTAFAQSFKCSIYAGAGGTPLPYTTILQAKAGYCLKDRFKLELSLIHLQDTFYETRRLQFYSFGLRYQVWGGWYALFGPAYTIGTLESSDGNFRGKRTSSSLDTMIGYEWYWKTVQMFLNLDIIRRYHALTYSIEYRTRDGILPTDLSKRDTDLSVNDLPLIE